jgi:two-component system OmpR family sensor kinase
VSLRVRLLLAVGAVALIALFVADVATYSSLRSFLYTRVDQSLDSASRALMRPGPFREDFGGSGSVVYTEFRLSDGQVRAYPGHMPSGAEFAPKLPVDLSSRAAITTITTGSARARVYQLEDGGQAIVAVPLDDTRATLRRLLVIETVVTLGALAAAAALGWSLVQLGLRPLADVEETAGAIADGDLDRRVPGDDAPTEVGQVARALNTMLERIQDAFTERDATEARLRRFVADASHELRTPLAAVSAYAEVFERGASTRPDDLSRVMAGIRNETKRMGDLVQDLLLLARLDEGRPPERVPIEVVGLAAEAVDAAMAVGPAWPVRLDAAAPAEVIGDHTQLRQVLDNLLANVRGHAPPGTAATVTITADEDAHTVAIAVHDDGPGLSDEQREKVFERFYRAEASRSRAGGGGAGLGLAIVAAIVEAHDGTVAVTTPPEGGVEFTVTLPQADVAGGEDGSGEGTDAPKSDAIRK